jgi:hypothetical protein
LPDFGVFATRSHAKQPDLLACVDIESQIQFDFDGVGGSDF